MRASAKFWKSPKIIKAVKEEEYRKLEHKRNGGSTSSKRTIIVESSSSDSDGGFPLLHRKRSHFEDTAVGGNIIGQLSVVRDKCSDLESMIMSVKHVVDGLQPAKYLKSDTSGKFVRQLFTCIICKDNSLNRDPVVPQCCSGVVACKTCLQDWIGHSSTCPQCREQISLDICLPVPPFRPLSALMESKSEDDGSNTD